MFFADEIFPSLMRECVHIIDDHPVAGIQTISNFYSDL